MVSLHSWFSFENSRACDLATLPIPFSFRGRVSDIEHTKSQHGPFRPGTWPCSSFQWAFANVNSRFLSGCDLMSRTRSQHFCYLTCGLPKRHLGMAPIRMRLALDVVHLQCLLFSGYFSSCSSCNLQHCRKESFLEKKTQWSIYKTSGQWPETVLKRAAPSFRWTHSRIFQ